MTLHSGQSIFKQTEMNLPTVVFRVVAPCGLVGGTNVSKNLNDERHKFLRNVVNHQQGAS
jgi:hypothetical protein